MGEAKELRELYKLLALLNEPDNQVYLAAVLRGNSCGIDDDTLYRFKQAGGRLNIFSPGELEKANEIEGLDSLLESFERIKKYHQWKLNYSPAVCLEKIIDDLGLYPLMLTVGEMKEPRCAYLYQVLEYARELESRGKTDFYSLVKKFEELLERNPEEELDLFSQKDSSVSLLNLHKAKGLQARVVFLANPGKKVDPEKFLSKHIQRLEDKPRGYFSFFRQKSFGRRQDIAIPPGWEEIKEEELKYQQSEETRLLYVGATRAEELLVISDAAEPKVKKNNPWQELIENSDENSDEKIQELEIESLPGAKELAGAREERIWEEDPSGLDDLSKLKEETYIVKTPTDLQKKKPKTSATSDTGSQGASSQGVFLESTAGEDELEGALLGNIIHRAFELIVKDKDKDKYDEERKHELVTGLVAEYLGETGDTTQEKDIINDMIDTFLSSNLIEELSQSPALQTEVPFHLRTEPGEKLHDYIIQNLGGKNSENIDAPIFFSGTMDLVYQKPNLGEEKWGKWAIVDYKTDIVDEVEAEELLQHAEIYFPQLKVYKEVFEIITGEKVCDFGVYFARIGEYVSLGES